ncbi:MAG: NIL domain-containing protein [Chloroflexi bacterium]|nr:NIL domain-containing protein [Chloroflexota bacterium]
MTSPTPPIRRVRLTYVDHLIKQPVVYELGRQFKVVTNVRRADVQENVGWIILEMDGEEDEIERALDWVRSLGIRIDSVVGDVVEG